MNYCLVLFLRKLNELRNNTEEYTKVRDIIFNKIIKEKEEIDEEPITWHIIRFCEKVIEEYLTNNGYYSETNKKYLKTSRIIIFYLCYNI